MPSIFSLEIFPRQLEISSIIPGNITQAAVNDKISKNYGFVLFPRIMDNISSCLVNLSAADPLLRTAQDPTFFKHSPNAKLQIQVSGQSEGGSCASQCSNFLHWNSSSAEKTTNFQWYTSVGKGYSF